MSLGLRSSDILEARLAALENDVRRARDEVEACSILVLSLDAAALLHPSSSSSVSGTTDVRAPALIDPSAGADKGLAQIAAKIETLEQAWAIRSSGIGRQCDESIHRLDSEVMDVWRAFRQQDQRHAQAVKDCLESLQQQERHLEDTKLALKEARSQKATTGGVEKSELDSMMKAMMGEISSQIAQLSSGLQGCQEEVSRMSTRDMKLDDDRLRVDRIEKAVEALVQQRRLDAQSVDRRLRDLTSRMTAIAVSGSSDDLKRDSVLEVQELRSELELLRSTLLPEATLQSTRASRALADGWHALREEVLSLRKDVGGMWDGQNPTDIVAALRADVEELRRQLAQVIFKDLEGGSSSLQREGQENWAECSRRLTALEGRPRDREQQLSLLADVRSLRDERQEDSANTLMMKHSVNRLERDVAELQRQRSTATGSRRSRSRPGSPEGDLTLTRRALAGSPVALGSTANSEAAPGRSGDGSNVVGFPVVLGRKVEWPLFAHQVARYRNNAVELGPMISEDVVVSGIPFRLKFYPDGSALRQTDGFCSLYLRTLKPANLRFRLFTGNVASPILEATSATGSRDLGRHDMCFLKDALDASGGVVIGVELLPEGTDMSQDKDRDKMGGGGSGS
eukprot:CAMPEP_0206579332 /NCGR_PEP_ID=MMETSP0325_2-20121206/32491_1 /ASSEMBLY_ACC=CAM_ASM_000347 /TAXON_ID=2866 /ORGANISM="Crypthecodinium cohnii, Strain Seligo" /LENGTH=625 /DNA_ID=CAMNT_0054085133 /DNA_START=8 /DNA_END=1886 /DNA_ORIENTATION=+